MNQLRALPGLVGLVLFSGCMAETPVRVVEDRARAVNSVVFTSAGDSLVSAGVDGSVRLLTVRDGRIVQTHAPHGGPAWAVSTSPRGDVVSGSNGGQVWLWSVRGGDHVAVEGASGVVRALAFSPAGDMVAVGAETGLGVARLGPAIAVEPHGDWKAWVYSLAFSPRGDLIAAGCGDGVTRIYGARNGKLVQKLETHKDAVYGVAFSPTEPLVATASLDGTIRLWSLADGGLLRQLEAHAQGALAIEFSSDGKSMLSAGRDGFVRVWARRDGALLRKLFHGVEVRSLALSPRGDLLATAGGDSRICLWKAVPD